MSEKAVKGPPHSPELEEAVLGALLDGLHCVDGLIADHFYLTKHHLIFRAIKHLSTDGGSTDLANVAQVLQERGQLEKVGGTFFISGLSKYGSPSQIQVERDARKLIELAAKRELRAGAIKLARSDWARSLAEIRPELDFISVALKDGISTETNLPFRTAREISESVEGADTTWIVPGLVAEGCITEVVGKVKASGKTTWLCHLARAIIRGETFLDRPAARSPVLYLTEEGASFRAATRRAGLENESDLVILNWPEVAFHAWPELVKAATCKAVEIGARLIIVDTLHQWARIEDENSSSEALLAINPLKVALTGTGLAIVLARHSRKAEGDTGDVGRGSSAISGAVDIIMQLQGAQGNPENVRTLKGLSRFEATPSKLTIRLQDGVYEAIGEDGALIMETTRDAILDNLPDTPEAAWTESELIKTLKASRTTVRLLLKELMKSKEIARYKKGNAYSYYVSDNDSTPKGGGLSVTNPDSQESLLTKDFDPLSEKEEIEPSPSVNNLNTSDRQSTIL